MTAARTLLLFGAGGQVGREVTTQSANAGWNVTGLSHHDLDIADREAVFAAVVRLKPAIVANAAAYTAVDKAETEEKRAFSVNCDGAGHIASAAAAAGAAVVHLSTDYVFDGTKTMPYIETDEVSPINVYGATKEAGERAVRAANPRHVILRTAWVYASHGHNFLRTMLRLAAERNVVRVVADQHGTPTAAADIAKAIFTIANGLERTPAYGTYHLTNSGQTTWFGFASRIFDGLSTRGLRRPRLEAIGTNDYPTPARRPRMSILDCTKLAGSLGISLRPWDEAVDDTLEVMVDKVKS